MKLILSNCSPAEAPVLARALVEERLAACVNLLPQITSVYTWDGALQEDTETTLLIKAATETVPALVQRIRELHSYTTPEIVVLDVDTDRSDPGYVDWVRKMSS